MSDALALSKSGGPKTNLPSHLEARVNDRQPITTKGSGHRVVKRRASRACHYCRAKKIRCSVVKSGSPCNTCRLDDVECLVSIARRKRRPRVAGVLIDPSSPPPQGTHQRWPIVDQPSTLDDRSVLRDSIYLEEDVQLSHSVGLCSRK